MSVTPPESLRTAPRQQRSRDRVEAILDAAAEVIDDVGYAATTTSMIVERADVSPGTLYRWFPDKEAVADALAERYLDALMAFYEPLIVNVPDEPVPLMIRRILTQVTSFVASQRALAALLASAVSPTDPSAVGQRLEANLSENLALLIELRVPDVSAAERDRVAAVIVRVVLTMLTAVPTFEPSARPAVTAEYADMLVAYVEAKFPSADDPVWNNPDPAVVPLHAAPQVPLPASAADETG